MTNLLLILLLLVGCESIREEIVERHSNGDKKLLVKYKGKGSDEIVIERVEYNEKGDTILYERPLEKISIERVYSEYNFGVWDDNDKGWYVDKYINNNNMTKKIIYTPKGHIAKVNHFKDGLLNGITMNYYIGGNKESEGNYNNGVKDGDWKYYDKSNEYLTIIDWDNGEAFVELYHDNGQLKEKSKIINGFDFVGYNYEIPMGKYEKYFEDGKIHTSYFVLDTIQTYYIPDGEKKMQIEVLYKGDYIEHWDNGQIKIKGSYDETGRKIGLHEQWWKDGTKDKGVEYKYGHGWDGYEYWRQYEDGERWYKITYDNGKKTSKIISYD